MADAHAGRICCPLAAAVILGLSAAAAAAEPAVSFTRDIKGILSNRCVRCHGPDAEDRHGGGDDGLRLDTFEGATEDLGGHAAIVPGKPTESELIARITSTDPDVVMPPPAAGERLSPREVELLTRWIAAGAEYEPHWAYVPPVQPPVPTVKDTAWPKNDIDRFILARLEAEGLSPQPAADRVTLARRLAIDLTGLPPTPEEVDAFVADAAPAAVERFTERLLAHDGYGEHVAREWLDLARYADSAGYADDRPRTIWGWRDWVIRACDANMPFDEFTIRQLAGDLLPDATADDRIATAFHRNTLTNSEGGTIDEEFRVAAVVDRVNTTMSTWMGTTMASTTTCTCTPASPTASSCRLLPHRRARHRRRSCRPGQSPPQTWLHSPSGSAAA
jgi:mono/diheme cytochrome c family protein